MHEKKILALILVLLSMPVHAKSIKCVDSKGVTHYGDTIPSECSNLPVMELDDKGVPMKGNPANMTPEERRSMELEVQKEAREAQKATEQRRRDSALLGTYSSESEIDMARDRNIQQASLSLSNVDSRLKAAKEKLDQYNTQAADFARSNKPVPADLAQSIAAAKKEYSDLSVERAQKKQDLDAMKAKFEADKKRYRELTQKPGQ